VGGQSGFTQEQEEEEEEFVQTYTREEVEDHDDVPAKVDDADEDVQVDDLA
jgi:hypothetical protein